MVVRSLAGMFSIARRNHVTAEVTNAAFLRWYGGRAADAAGARAARTEGLAQLALAQPDRVRRHLDELVLVDPLEAVLEVHRLVGDEADRFVVAGGAHVGELLLAADVHVEVDVARVFA